MICSICGTEVADGVSICPNCGNNVNEVDVATCINAELPREICHFNWGAFGFTWLWGLFNNTYIALLDLLLIFVPIVGLFLSFGFRIFLGVKGNNFAWLNNKWESTEHFNKIQKRWAIALIILLLVSSIFALLLPDKNVSTQTSVQNQVAQEQTPSNTTNSESYNSEENKNGSEESENRNSNEEKTTFTIKYFSTHY